MKAWYSQKIFKLCNSGQLESALALVDEMVSSRIALSHYNFSALIQGTISSDNPCKYRSIWSEFENKYGIKPNHVTYSLLISAASRCNHVDTVNEIAKVMQQQHGNVMDTKSWNQLISALGRINSIDAMLEALDTMKQSTIAAPDSCTMACSLNQCIRMQRFEEFHVLLEEIMESKQVMMRLLDDHVLVAIVDGLSRNDRTEYIEPIWNEVLSHGFKPNINCYGTVIVALSHNPKQRDLVDSLVSSMKRGHLNEMKYDRVWNQILIAYSNLKDQERVWKEYEEMKLYYTPNAITLSILCAECSQKALDEAKAYIAGIGWDTLSHRELKGFERVAAKVGDKELIQTLQPILTSKMEEDRVDVVAQLTMDGMDERVRFDNFYKFEHDSILQTIQDLIKETEHRIDTKQHPEIDAVSAHRLIAYHAEKKALAFALNKGAMDITIRLNLRMCNDCHRFFCNVSSLHPSKEITVFDPRKRHNFRNGTCSCAS